MKLPNTNPKVSSRQVIDWIDATKRELKAAMQRTTTSDTCHLLDTHFDKVKELTDTLEKLEWLSGLIIAHGK